MESAVSRLESASVSDVGRVRGSNQDAAREFEDGCGAHLFVVADGMGGERGGEIASALAVETCGEVFQTSTAAPAALLRSAFELANERIHAHASRTPGLRGMGTTAVALLFSGPEHAWVAHAGDSRAYRVRGGAAQPLTEDHSVVAELVRRGVIDRAAAPRHPRRSEILRALGSSPRLEADVAPVDVQPGDRFVLCSDGLWDVVSDVEIAAHAGSLVPDEAARELIALANQRGGPDNVTVQVIAVTPPTAERVAPAPAPAFEARSPARASRLPLLAAISLVLAAGLVVAILWLALGGPGAELDWRGLWQRLSVAPSMWLFMCVASP